MSVAERRGGSDSLILVLSCLGAIEFLGAALAVVFGFGASDAPIILGLSAGRMVLAGASLAIAAALLTAGFVLRHRLTFRDTAATALSRWGGWIATAGMLAAALGWISVFAPSYLFGEYASYFSRLRPLLIASSLWACELWMAAALSRRSESLHFRFPKPFAGGSSPFVFSLALLLAVWGLMLFTKFGVAKTGPFWNPPGVPLTGVQGISGVILICLGVLVSTGALPGLRSQTRRRYAWLMPVALYACALLIWGFAPMERHYFSLRPAPPSFQPFPFSDARFHDLGALSILDGQGIYFHGFTDKPLYMVFVAILHVVGGNDYVFLTWLQLAVLALIPVVLYFLGRAFHGEVLGAAVGLLIILQQRNSILASRVIDSVNPKLLMTEVPTLLLLALVAYLAFRWFSTCKPHYALATGAAIGASSLVRVNPVFLWPALGVLAVAPLRSSRRPILRHLLIFSAGFLVVFSPWLAFGVDASGIPWFWVKFQRVIGQRLQSHAVPGTLAGRPSQDLTPASLSVYGAHIQNAAYVVYGSTGTAAVPTRDANNPLPEFQSGALQLSATRDVLTRALSHSLHNGAAALLSLPDLVNLESLDRLGRMQPWGKTTWGGALTPTQHVAVVGNIILVALGLARSWQRLKWAGLSPLFVFLGYDFSLAVATTSGGRYVVPINWVAHFYWALGWLVVIGAIAHADAPAPPGGGASSLEPDRLNLRAFRGWLVAALFVAAWAPLADVAVPAFLHPHVEEGARAELSAVVPPAASGERLLFGQVLYPYYLGKNRSISFTLLTDGGYIADLLVPRDQVFPYGALQAGSLGAVAVATDDPTKAARYLYVAQPH